MGRSRMPPQTHLVLRVLLDHPTRGRYGLELSEALGLMAGTIYPVLSRRGARTRARFQVATAMSFAMVSSLSSDASDLSTLEETMMIATYRGQA